MIPKESSHQADSRYLQQIYLPAGSSCMTAVSGKTDSKHQRLIAETETISESKF